MHNELSPDEVAFFAGVVDSRGSISIGLDGPHGKRYYYEQYRISGDQEILGRLQSRFGGSVSTNGRNCKRIWRVTADVARNLFVTVRPMLVRRRAAVDIVLDFGRQRHELSGVVEGVPKETTKNALAQVADRTRRRLQGLAQAELVPENNEYETTLGEWFPHYQQGAGVAGVVP